jgi:hypothetical protein
LNIENKRKKTNNKVANRKKTNKTETKKKKKNNTVANRKKDKPYSGL